jgi:hypothetical protein
MERLVMRERFSFGAIIGAAVGNRQPIVGKGDCTMIRHGEQTDSFRPMTDSLFHSSRRAASERSAIQDKGILYYEES